MPIEVKELYEDGGYEEDTRGRQAARSFSVSSSSEGINAAQAYEAVGIKIGDPLFGDAGEDLGLRAMRIAGKPNRSPYTWKVVVTYSNAARDGPTYQAGGNSNRLGDGGLDSLGGAGGPDGSGGGGAPAYGPPGPPAAGPQLVTDPLARPPQVSWSTGRMMRVVEKDIDGRMVRNSAMLPFDPPLEREEFYDVLTVVKNQRQYKARELGKFRGAVNKEPWLGDGRRTWRIEDVTATREYEEGTFFWKVTYVFHFKEDTWDLVLLDAGTWEFDVTEDDWQRCVGRFGSPASRPVPLDGTGHAIEVENGQLVSEPVFLDPFKIYKELDFRDMKLFKPDA